jgi:protein-tyrosine phosphatase
MKILMVCLGNICRSPLADGILRRKVRENKLDVVVDSAGTSGFHTGEAPDTRMQETSLKRGTPIDFLRARQFTPADFEQFDLIYVMDKSNRENVLKLARNGSDEQKVRLILNEITPATDQEVPDPYFGGWEGFEHVYDLLDHATDVIIEKIKNKEI